MQAVVLTKPRQVSVQEVADPQLQAPTDVLLRLYIHRDLRHRPAYLRRAPG